MTVGIDNVHAIAERCFIMTKHVLVWYCKGHLLQPTMCMIAFTVIPDANLHQQRVRAVCDFMTTLRS